MKLTDRIGEGRSADVYLDKGYVYKVYHSEQRKHEVFLEAFVTTFVRKIGIPVPNVHEVSDHEKKTFIKMDYIVGKSLDEMIVRFPNSVEMCINVMVNLQMQIHEKKVNFPIRLKERMESQICAASQLTFKEKEQFIGDVRRLPDEECLCHGDFRGGNILCRNNRYTIIDWADAAVGHRYADVCKTYLGYLLCSRMIAEEYLDTYCMRTGSDRKEVLQWLKPVAAARLSENNEWESQMIHRLLRQENQ